MNGGSRFNRRRQMPAALAEVLERVPAEVVVLSYNDESWIDLDRLRAMVIAARGGGEADVVGFDSPRYVGARIGIYNPSGERVGRPTRLRNVEYLVIAGPGDLVRRAADAARRASAQAATSEATAQTVAISPMPAMTSERASGARASSPS